MLFPFYPIRCRLSARLRGLQWHVVANDPPLFFFFVVAVVVFDSDKQHKPLAKELSGLNILDDTSGRRRRDQPAARSVCPFPRSVGRWRKMREADRRRRRRKS